MKKQLQEQQPSPMRMVNMADKAFTCLLNRLLEEHLIDLTAEQCHVLNCLWKNDGLNHNEIAEKTNKDKTTISRHIHHLRKKGFIKRAILESDRRNKLIFLTESGKGLKKTVLAQMKKAESQALRKFSEDEIGVLQDGLDRVIANLKKGIS
ncbi:MAG: MarR family transcriptional regulator [Saprospiraceae bacterium]|nr:MarR family transcriptional regulator [Bacteroidota bacterium]MCB9313976.1 MarR family transcriptional regulator [Lewinellaceae bacterium]